MRPISFSKFWIHAINADLVVLVFCAASSLLDEASDSTGELGGWKSMGGMALGDEGGDPSKRKVALVSSNPLRFDILDVDDGAGAELLGRLEI